MREEIESIIELRRDVLELICLALVGRKCAFSVNSLVECARSELSVKSSAILIQVFFSFIRGLSQIQIVEGHNDINFYDRQVVLTVHWIEALLDAHFTDFVREMSSSRRNDSTLSKETVTSQAIRSIHAAVKNIDKAFISVEGVLGVWGHISRSSKAGLLSEDAGYSAFGGNRGMKSSSLYQVESLQL